LNKFTEVESATITSSSPAPISRAMRAPNRAGMPIQSFLFQLRIRSSPHSRETTSAMRPGVEAGSAPSELPSR